MMIMMVQEAWSFRPAVESVLGLAFGSALFTLKLHLKPDYLE